MPRPLTPRRAAFARLLVVVLLLACPGRHADAQGTSGMLPDPIGAADFAAYAELLRLSPQQRATLMAMHATYKLEFRKLRETEIREFLESMHGLQSSGMFPEKEVVEKFLADLDMLRGKIRQLDRKLFDEVVMVLTEEQLAALPRVRRHRERARYTASVVNGMFFGGQIPEDLSATILDLDLEAPDVDRLTPELIRYEQKLTTLMGKLEKSTSSTLKRLFEALEEAGMGDIEPDSEEAGMLMMQTMQTIMADIAKEALGISEEIRDLNRTTARRLRDALDGAGAVRVHNAILDAAYASVAHSHRFDDAVLRQATVSASLDEDVRARATVLLDEFEREMFRLGDEAIKAHDETMSDMNPMLGNVDWQERQRKIEAIGKTGQEAQARLQAALVELVGADMVATLRGESHSSSHAAHPTGVATELARAEALAERAEAAVATGWTYDQFVQHPITDAQLQVYGKTLDFDETDRTIMKALLEQHEAEYAAVRDNQLKAIGEAQRSLWSQQEDGSWAPPTAEKLDAIQALRVDARAAIDAVDQAFFDDVEEILLETEESPAMERVRAKRARELYGRVVHTGYPMGDDKRAVDLVTLASTTLLDQETRPVLIAALDDYSARTLELFRERFEASSALAHAVQQWSADNQRRQHSGDFDPNEWQALARKWLDEPHARLKRVDEQIVELNDAALETLQRTVSTDAALALRNAYRHTAFPEVYADPTVVERHLSAARDLRDLDATARSRIDDLSAEYVPAYEAMCDALIELHRGLQRPWLAATEEVDWAAFQKKQDEIAQIRFDRNELNGQIIVQLQALLSEDQIRRIGGLPDMADGRAGNWWD